jgi:hypothetical protein
MKIEPQGENTLYGGQIGQESYIYIYIYIWGFFFFHLVF